MSNKLVLTEEEFGLVKRQVSRLYEHKNRIGSREQRRKEMEFKLLKGLNGRLIKAGEQMLNRNDIRAIEGICNIGKKALEDLILPGYKERQSKAKSEEERERYEEYLKKASLTLAVYNDIMLKLEAFI